MIALLDLVNQSSEWSGIRLNANKCKITAFLQDLQTIPRKRDRDDALRARLAHVTLGGRPIGSLTQDEPLPGVIWAHRSQPPYARMPTYDRQKSRYGESERPSQGPPYLPTFNNASYSMELIRKLRTRIALCHSPPTP